MKKQSKQPKLTKQKEPALTISRDEAKKQLNERIAAGMKIKEKDISNESDLENSDKSYKEWSKQNYELLRKIFDTDIVANEYQTAKGLLIMASETNEENRFSVFVNNFQNTIAAKIEELESVIEKMESFSAPSIVILEEKPVSFTVDKKGNTLFKDEVIFEERESTIDEKENTIDEKENTIDEKENTIDEKENTIDEKEGTVDIIESVFNKIETVVDIKESSIYRNESSMDKKEFTSSKNGNTIYIGHGAGRPLGRLKEFLEDELKIKTISFDFGTKADNSIIPSLEKLLSGISFAILLLNNDDEIKNRKTKALQNLIYETGLLQGRLGFKKVIFLQQEGAEELTDLPGVQSVKFSGDTVEQSFYELNRLLKREQIVK